MSTAIASIFQDQKRVSKTIGFRAAVWARAIAVSTRTPPKQKLKKQTQFQGQHPATSKDMATETTENTENRSE